MRGVLLRIFSGQHLGAEIELPDGIHVIGTDDSCDIILSDPSLSGRHAALHVSQASGSPHVEAEPLDGVVILDGAAAAATSSLPPAHPFQLATVFLAWSPTYEEAFNDWEKVRASLAADKAAPEEHQADETPPATEREPAADQSTATDSGIDTPNAPDNANNAVTTPAAAIETLPELPQKRGIGARLFKWLIVAAAFLAALFLCFSYERHSSESPKAVAEKLLREAGYEKLVVTDRKDSVTISGRIASDSERGRILRLAQFLQFPVYLDLTVRSDAAEAVKSSYNAMGLYPEVTELPPSAHPGLLVRGYIRDGVLEEQALQQAKRNVPSLKDSGEDKKPALEIYSDIRHMKEVRNLLEPALVAQGMRGTTRVEYLPGRIVIHGALTPQTRAMLSDIAARVQQQLDVPVPVDIVNGFLPQGEATQATRQNTEHSAAAKQDENTPNVNFVFPSQQGKPDEAKAGPAAETKPDTKPATEAKAKADTPVKETPHLPQNNPPLLLQPRGFKVTSVSMGALRFITLDNGERVFEGGELPGGYVVDSISVDELILSKDNRKTSYPLRGSHE